MQRVAIVSDSACDLPAGLAADLGIELAPVHTIIDGRDYRDRVDIPVREAYRALVERRAVSTAGASGQDFLEAYQRALERAESVICLSIGPSLSVTYRNALAARELLEEADITVVDSRSVLAPQGLVALAAARAAREGAGREEVLALIERLIDRTHMFFTADTLEFMARGGRLRMLEEELGSLEGQRPVLRVAADGWHAVGKAPSREASIEECLRRMHADLQAMGWRPGHPLRVVVDQALCEEEAEALLERLRREYRVEEGFLWEVSPTAGVHLGPGMLGVAYQLL
ncbi:MAG: DegV family EDD domain-containing protein [Firmicutes bacterium]|nr:DegV family EDD domain-containing protein [Bacillota bacterium]